MTPYSLPKLDKKQIGIFVAISLAAAMTIFHSRLLGTALPDLRGIWGLSFDEGSVLNTAATAPQLILAPVVPWMITVFGYRRVLIPAAIVFILVSFFIPFITGHTLLFAAHIILGMLLGVFVPATILIILQCLPPAWWIFGLAFFTFRVSLGTNVGVSLGALYTEFLGWQWIYWQSALVMLVYLILIHRSVGQREIRRDLFKNPDFSGMAFLCVASTLIYIGFDQGERLGWFDSGFITICFAGGILLLAGFLWNEKVVPNPFARPQLLLDRNIIAAVLLLVCKLCILSANSILITTFLSNTQALKPLQSGDALLLIALAQLLLTPFYIYLIRRVDVRLTCAFGFLAAAMACYLGTFITVEWASADFIPIAILLAVAHPFIFLSIMAMLLASFEAHTAPRLLAYVQATRLIAPIACGAIMSLVMRLRKDSHSLFLSQYMTGNEHKVSSFLEAGGTLSELKSMVSMEALVLSFQDTFALCFGMAMLGLVILTFMKPFRPTPISPVQVLPEPARTLS